MKKRTKRLLAMLLASAMILQQGSTVAVLAAESEPASETVAETTAATEAETKTPETKAPETQAETKAAEPETQAVSETQATEAAPGATQTEAAAPETTETAAETTEKATEAQTTAPEEDEAKADAEAKTKEAEAKADETEAPKTNFTYEDNRVKITAAAQEAAKLPQDAALKADYLVPGSKEYNDAVAVFNAQLAAKLGATDENVVVEYVLYDIYFVSGNTRIEPEEGKVKVEMTFKTAEQTKTDGDVIDSEVVHLKDNGQAEIVTDYVNVTEDGTLTSMGFTQDSFSIGGAAIVVKQDEDEIDPYGIMPIDGDGDGEVDQSDTVSLSTRKPEGNTGTELMVSVNTTASRANTAGKSSFRLDVEMDAGVVLSSFMKDGEYVFDEPFEVGNGENKIKVTLHKDTDSVTGKEKYYLTYDLDPGDTGYFELVFTTPNGTTDNGAKAKVTPHVTTEGGTGNSSATPSEGLELTWDASFDWGDVKKTVVPTTVEPTSDKTLSEDLEYTIKNESTNNTAMQEGEIWTEYVTFTDTFKLPEGLYFDSTKTYTVDNSAGTITCDGKVICKIENDKLSNGDTPPESFTISDLAIDTTNGTISYKVTIENPYGTSGVPASYTKEMGNPSFKMTLDKSSVHIKDNANVSIDGTLRIDNDVAFYAKSIFSYTDDSPASASTTVKENPDYSVTKTVDKERVKAEELVSWSVTVKNESSVTLPPHEIVDSLPKGLIPLDDDGNEIVFTDPSASMQAYIGGKLATVTYDQWNYTITWSAETVGSIAGNQEYKIENIKTKVADEDTLKQYFGDNYLNETFTNSVTYREKKGTKDVVYDKPNVELAKVGDKDVAQNGDTVTYTITITNKEEKELKEKLTDTIPKGMILLDDDNKEITASGTYTVGGKTVQVTINDNGTTTLVVELEVGAGSAEVGTVVTYQYNVKIDADAVNNGTAGNKYLENTVKSDSGLTGKDTVTVPTEGVEPDKKVRPDQDSTEWAGNGEFEEDGWIKYQLSIHNPSDQSVIVKDVKDWYDDVSSGTFKSKEYWGNPENIQVKEPGFEQYYVGPEDEGYNSAQTTYTVSQGEIKWPALKIPAGVTATQEIWFRVPKGSQYKDLLQALKDQNSNEYKEINNKFSFNGSEEKSVWVKPKQNSNVYIDMQKGVYALGQLSDLTNTSNGTLTQKPSRYLFQSAEGMYVVYYFVARNTGETPVTVYKAEDTLPEGVKYKGICQYVDNWASLGQYADSQNNPGNNIHQHLDGGNGNWNNTQYWIQTKVSSTSTEKNVVFIFGDGEGVTLNPGVGLTFIYLCEIDKTYTDANTGKNMVNTVSLAAQPDARLKDSESWTVKTVAYGNDVTSDQNNGRSIDGGIRGDYYWVDSSVSIKPYTGIVPGILKNARYYKNPEKEWVEIQENSTINPGAAIRWEVRLENTRGLVPMHDYTVTDMIQAPYTIDTTKTYSYQIYNADGTPKGNALTVQLTTGTPEYGEDGKTVEFNVYSARFSDVKYDIPAGGSAVLTVETENKTTSRGFGTFTNKANLKPEQDFNGNNVVHGELQEGTEGDWDSVTASDSVFILGQFGSVSGKTITEKDNPYNVGVGNLIDSNKHFIYVEQTADGEKDDVIYTNSVKNISDSDYTRFIMIDTMPYIGDTGVVNGSDDRGSEFTVKLPTNPVFSAVLTLADGSEHEFSSDQFTVEYSSKVSPFSNDDWNADSEWDSTYDPAIHKSFRLKFKNDVTVGGKDPGVILPSGATITVTYEGRIQSDADPGEFAWNSFGYRYYSGDTGLTAEPPKVGVSIPSEPTIKKVVVDEAGNDLGAGDAEFTLKFYEGELTAETVQGKTPVHELKVKQGGSAQLETKRTVNGVEVGFLEEGKTYTVVEEPVDGYEIKGIEDRGNSSTTNYFTFKYTADDDQLIVVTNTKKEAKGKLSVTKQVANNPGDDNEFSIRVDFSIGDEDKIDSLPAQVAVQDREGKEASYALMHDSETDEIVDGKIIKGHIVLTLKQDETLTIVKLAEGIRFKVAETALPEGIDYVSSLAPHNEEKDQPVSYTGVIGQKNEVEGGEPTQEQKFEFAVTVTNTEVVDKTVTKEWSDDNNANGNRPDSIQVQLYADSAASGTPVELKGSDGWTYTWENLPKYKADGTEITYTIQEVGTVTGYTSTVDGWTITNTEEVTKRTATKVWADNNDQDGLRPESIEVQLLADGVAFGAPKPLNEDNDWTCSWDDLPKYKNKTEVVYSVREENVPEGYESTAVPTTETYGASFTITNTHTPEVVSKTVTKVWEDGENRDRIRPDSITVQLLADGVASGVPETLNAANGWTHTWNNLPKNADGEEITYTVQEIGEVTGYTTKYDQDTLTITNTHTPDVVEKTVTKVWVDDDDQDGLRPKSIEVQLFADDDSYGEPVTLTADDWTYTWHNLPKNKNGKEITYTVQETSSVTGYTTTYSDDTFTITNTYTPGKTSRSVRKVWNDSDNQDGLRPEAIQVQLLANGEPYDDPETLNADNHWSHTWTGLDVNEDGKLIEYTVQEIGEITGYTTAYDQDTLTITNTHTPDEIEKTVTKVWEDNEDQDGLRPDDIQVQLLADGEPYGAPVKLTADHWTYTWHNLPKSEGGDEITYTVQEIGEVTGYTTAYSGDTFTITNTHTPEKINVTGTKTWNDGNNQDETRPESITVTLQSRVKNAEPEAEWKDVPDKVVTVKPDANGNWTYSFADLPAYENEKTLEYRVREANVPGYLTEYAPNGKDITNTVTSVSVSKVDIADGEELEGAHIQILDEEGNIVEEWDSTIEPHEVKGLVTGKKYTLRETVAPDGYKVTTDTEFTLKSDGTIDNSKTTTTVKDGVLLVEDDMTSVKISKVDVTSQEELEGAHIQILDEEGNPVAEWDSTTEPHEVKGLVTGKKYTLRETVAPDGYTVTTDTEFTLKSDGTIDDGKTTTTVKDGVLLVNDSLNRISLLKIDESGAALTGAKLVVKDAAGNVVKDAEGKDLIWTTSDKAQEITGLAPGTYTLSELEAPAGYDVAADETFTITGKEKAGTVIEVKMTDKKTVTTNRSLTVTKNLRVLGYESLSGDVGLHEGKFYVALFSDAARTQRVSDVKTIVFKDATASSVTFNNLAADVTYYVGETDVNGTFISSTTPEGFYPEYGTSAEFKFEGSTSTGTADFTNVYVEWPDSFYLSGQLTVTKKVLLNGKENNTTDTFYARVFKDAALTDPVSNEVLVLSMAGKSTTSVTVTNLTIGDTPDSSRKYYVAETDAYGIPLNQDAVEFEISVDKSEVVLSGQNSRQEVVITNSFTEEEESEFEEESESETEVDEKKTAPKTGDHTDFTKYLLLLTLSAGTCAVLFEEKCRKNRAER